MHTIWKYKLDPEKEFIQMPKFAKILAVREQNDDICIWVEIPDSEEIVLEKRYFHVFGTGHRIEEVNLVYYGTVQLAGGRLIFHVYEELWKDQ